MRVHLQQQWQLQQNTMMLLRMRKRLRENVYTMYTEHIRPNPEFFSQHLHREQSEGTSPLCPICSTSLTQEETHTWHHSESLASFISSLISKIAYGIRQWWIKPRDLYREFCLREYWQILKQNSQILLSTNSTKVQVNEEIYNLRFAHGIPSYRLAHGVKKAKIKLVHM